jgi:hypothetical protein
MPALVSAGLVESLCSGRVKASLIWRFALTISSISAASSAHRQRAMRQFFHKGGRPRCAINPGTIKSPNLVYRLFAFILMAMGAQFRKRLIRHRLVRGIQAIQLNRFSWRRS